MIYYNMFMKVIMAQIEERQQYQFLRSERTWDFEVIHMS